MSSDLDIEPVGGLAGAAIDQDAAEDTAPMRLPARQAAMAPDVALAATRHRRSDAGRDTARYAAERKTSGAAFRVTDNRTSLVVREFSDEAQLRARAYGRAIADAKLAAARGGITTDVTA